MRHNKEEINAERLFELLDSISQFIEIPLNFYALGGTALTILNLKRSTLDIDINIDSEKEYKYICTLFERIGFERKGPIRWITQEGLAFDLFYGSYILGTDLLKDCLKKSKFIRSFGNLKLYTLSLYDIIISKLARGEIRDFDDIKSILDNETLDVNELIFRYHATMETSIVANHKQKLLDLIEFKFEKWGIKIDQKFIDEVKTWE